MRARRVLIEVAAALILAAVCTWLVWAILSVALPVPVWPAT